MVVRPASSHIDTYARTPTEKAKTISPHLYIRVYVSKSHIPPAVAIRVHTTLIGKEQKGTNKRTEKQYVAEVYIQYNLSYLMFVPNFNILGQVVPGHSLMLC